MQLAALNALPQDASADNRQRECARYEQLLASALKLLASGDVRPALESFASLANLLLSLDINDVYPTLYSLFIHGFSLVHRKRLG